MWNLLLNDDERMIADSVRQYLEQEMPLERLRPHATQRESGLSPLVGIAELGWLGLGLPEAAGGAGLGLIAEVLLQRECGRHLVSPSVLATTLAAHLALQAGDTGRVRALISGELTAALAILIASPATPNPACLVFDWNGRDDLLLWNIAGMSLFPADAFAGHQREACLDDSVTMHSGVLALHRARHQALKEQTSLVLRGQVLLSAALIGLAENACDITVAYAKVREQFGKPIGSFQAVKHRCADMGLRWRLGWYQTSLAALKVVAGSPDAKLHAASAKLLSTRAAHENGRAAIQMHGGIGFQAECDVHWFMKRAHLYGQAGGSMSEQARCVIAEPSPLTSGGLSLED
jgi:alkylation response protein AidB-like acyl-CoA dehydrogenase